jgi:methyl-accepting chemotaxis protein
VIKELMFLILPVGAGIGVVALAVGIFLSFFITKPIREFNRATKQIVAEGGDLTMRIHVRSRDELGDLAQNLNQLFERLQSITAEVQQSAFQVGTSSTELSAASKQMLDGATEQALKIDSSTAAVTELSSSIQQVADNAMQTTKVAQSSGEEVSDAIDRMNQIRGTVEEVGRLITDLGESGKRIGKIVEVIRQISEQTSLLALNASIEAAHAGEQGRGFAVVADEVSSLARRVGQSAKDIEDLIATITDQTAGAVQTMGVAIQEVEQGTTLVKSTMGSIQKIVEVIQDTATAVQEQALASDEIARNMDAVQRIAQEVLGSSEEAVVQGERLQALGLKLEDMVKGFKVAKKASAVEPAAPAKALKPPSAADKGQA